MTVLLHLYMTVAVRVLTNMPAVKEKVIHKQLKNCMGKEKSIDVSYDKDTNTELNKVKDVFEVKEVLARLNKPFVLVKLLQGLDLQAMDFNGKSDPYVIFTLGSRSVRSTIKYATLQPKWDETFVLSIDSLQNMKLIVDVYDHDRFTADDAMGDTVIDLSKYIHGEQKMSTVILQNVKKGKLVLAITVFSFEMKPKTVPPPVNRDLLKKNSATTGSVTSGPLITEEESSLQQRQVVQHGEQKTLQRQATRIIKRAQSSQMKTESAKAFNLFSSVTEVDDGTEPYEDPNFPCNEASLRGSEKSDVGANVTQWLRTTQLCSNPQLFVGGSAADDVIQGQLGDCWFLGALSIVGTRQDLLNHCVAVTSANPSRGHYAFRFYKEGKWVTVHIDDRLPCDRNGNLVFARCGDPNETWVPLIEKAYAKLHGSYHSLEGGKAMDAIVDLTGGVAIGEQEIDSSLCNEDFWNELAEKLHRGCFMMGVSLSEKKEELAEEKGLLSAHQYTILSCTQTKTGYRLLKIRNPWGHREWNGRWSDGSKEWTPKTIEEVGATFGDDGTFYMCFEDFCSIWSVMDTVKIFNDPHDSLRKNSNGLDWNIENIVSKWGPGESGYNNPENPQFVLHLENKSRVCLSILQYDSRYIGDHKELDDPIALQIMEYQGRPFDSNNPKLSDRRFDFSSSSTVTRTKFKASREVYLETDLDQGTYIVVASTYYNNTETPFVLRTFVNSAKFQIAELPPRAEAYGTISIQGEWDSETAGGCGNTWQWTKNPQYLIQVSGNSEPIDLAISLTQEEVDNTLFALGYFVLEANATDPQAPVCELRTVTKSKNYTTTEQVTAVVQSVASGQKYVYIPTTFSAGEKTKFTIGVSWRKNLYPDCKIDFKRIPVSSVSVKSQWTQEHSGGCSNSISTWLNNPQIELRAQNSGSVNISLIQQDTNYIIGFYVFETSTKSLPIVYSNFAAQMATHLTFRVQADTKYIILPCTFDPHQLGGFEIKVWANSDNKITLQ